MFQEPFSFSGRIRRLEFGISFLLYALYITALGEILKSYGEDSGAIMLFMLVPAVWFLFAQGAKRCHDLDNSGWYQLIPYYIFWLIFAKGKNGKNKYGPDPKDNDDEESTEQYTSTAIATDLDQPKSEEEK